MPRILTFGEIMLRLSPPGHKRFSQASNFEVIYGGGESNVAVTLANYGLDARFVTRLPKNDIGDCFMSGLIYALLNWPDDDATALRFAVADSALKHSIFGDANLVTPEEMLRNAVRITYLVEKE